jgi:hypothetical protein
MSPEAAPMASYVLTNVAERTLRDSMASSESPIPKVADPTPQMARWQGPSRRNGSLVLLLLVVVVASMFAGLDATR